MTQYASDAVEEVGVFKQYEVIQQNDPNDEEWGAAEQLAEKAATELEAKSSTPDGQFPVLDEALADIERRELPYNPRSRKIRGDVYVTPENIAIASIAVATKHESVIGVGTLSGSEMKCLMAFVRTVQ